MAVKKPLVLIVGAGLGGLTLAQSLRKNNISYEIFERDEGLDARRQGWAIGLHSILEDLQAAVGDDLPPIAPYVNHLQPLKLQPQFIMNVSGLRLGVTGGSDAFVLRASRQRLRGWLSTNMHIAYGKRVIKIEESADGVVVHFQDGSSASGDILVGADGINSCVREHLLSRPNDQVLRTNAFAVVVGETTLTGVQFERQLALSHSAYLAVSDDRTLSIFVGLDKVSEDGKTGSYYWFFMIPDENTDDADHWIRHASPAERRDKALNGGKKLDDRFTEIMKLTPVEGIRTDAFSFRDAEIDAKELSSKRVTLLGDAAHPMAPFRGEGGVHAIRDGLNLAACISKIDGAKGDDIMNALKAYQHEMMSRGTEAVRQSRGQVRRDRQEGEPWMIWGHPARPTPEEDISLDNWL